MTRFHREFTECGHCLNEEEVVIWDVIDAEKDPDLVEKILRKELQVFFCQNCNRSYILQKPLLLIDRPHHLMVYYRPDMAQSPDLLPRARDGRLAAEAEALLPHDFGFPTDDLTLRLVTSYNDLIEKIHLAREGLSDRLMEVVKLAMEARLAEEDRLEAERRKAEAAAAAEENPEAAFSLEAEAYAADSEGDGADEAENALYFLGIEDGKFLFQRFHARLGWRQVELAPEVYRQAEGLLEDHLPAEGRWDLADRVWAARFIEAAGEALAAGR